MQDRGGLIQALAEIGELTWFTREDGSYGQNDADVVNRRANNTKRLRRIFEELAEDKRTPDVLIAQTWADYIDSDVFSELRKKFGVVVVNIGMDDRHRWQGIKPLIPHLDLALTAAPECVAWYEAEGCPAMFFAEASCPNIYYPMPDIPKLYDVGFVGGCYGVRKKIISSLRDSGVNVVVYGSGWGTGRLPTEEIPKFFAQSKIVLGVGTIGHCADFYALKMRDFDGPLSGSFYLTHDNPDLGLLYNIGSEIMTYKNTDDCVDSTRYFLAHDVEREKIARAGYKRAMNSHTWRQRFEDLMGRLKIDG